MAAPGRMAWLMASPMAHAPQHEKHADRRRAQRQRKATDQRAAHESEVEERIDEGVDHAAHARKSPPQHRRRRRAGRRARFSASDAPRRSPRRTSRASSSVLGKCARTCSMSCSAAMTVRPSSCQRSIRTMRSAMVSVSTARNGSSSRISRASCNRRRANSTRWNWPPDKGSDDAIGKVEQAECRESAGHGPLAPRVDATPDADLAAADGRADRTR